MNKSNEEILRFVDELIGKAEGLISTSTYRELSLTNFVTIEGFYSLHASCNLLLEWLGGISNPWKQQFMLPEKSQNAEVVVKRFLGALNSIKESIEKGRLTTYKELVFSEAFSNLTEQADYLLEKGYFIAAGVLYRAVLEEKLRRLCEINECMPDKDRPTIYDYNMSLYKGEKYDKMTMKLVDVMAAIGNKATHAKGEIVIGDVRKLKSDLEFFMSRF